MPVVHKFLNLREYHRPADRGEGLDAALTLLARPGMRTVVLAGGDTLLASGDPTVEAVVDLQGLGLNVISVQSGSGQVRVGAMVTRTTLAAWGADSQPASLRGLLAVGAHRWGGSVQRNRATVGGAVVTAASNDPLVAALLACDAEVVLVTPGGERVLAIVHFLQQRPSVLAAPAIITELRAPDAPMQAAYACETVQRTPYDAPIVLAVAGLACQNGRCTYARLVVGGVAETPVRIDRAESSLVGAALSEQAIAEAADRAAAAVDPTGDFRGSAEYRRAMAKVLARHALENAAGRAGQGAN